VVLDMFPSRKKAPSSLKREWSLPDCVEHLGRLFSE
jgi:hypothetical protein